VKAALVHGRYDMPELIGVAEGVLTRADPASLAIGQVGLLSSAVAGVGLRVEVAGVLLWPQVAVGMLAVAGKAGNQ
jgi:hypothetical protein